MIFSNSDFRAMHAHQAMRMDLRLQQVAELTACPRLHTAMSETDPKAAGVRVADYTAKWIRFVKLVVEEFPSNS